MTRSNGLRFERDVPPLVHPLLDSRDLGHAGSGKIAKQDSCSASFSLSNEVCGRETYLHEN